MIHSGAAPTNPMVSNNQFVPLPEALCHIISNLNQRGRPANLDTVRTGLHRQYHNMLMPKTEILYGTLSALVSDGKLYCTGEHYFVSSATANMLMYSQPAVNYNQIHPPFHMPPGPGTKLGWQQDAAPYYFGAQNIRQQPPGSPPVRTTQTCSIECQTGASIINAPISTKAPVGSQSAHVNRKKPPPHSAAGGVNAPKKQTTSTETCTEPQFLVPAIPKQHKGKQSNFFARLFTKRSKSRDRNSIVRKSQTVDSDLKGSSNAQVPQITLGATNNSADIVAPSNGRFESQPPAFVSGPQDLGQFSAQFPPTEWLHDPRYLQATIEEEHDFFKHRRSKKERHNDECKVRQSGYNQQQPTQRFCTFPENLLGGSSQAPGSPVTARIVPREQGRARDHVIAQRFSKYLSSSSECLQYLGPVDPPELLRGYAELEGMVYNSDRSQKHRSRAERRKQRQKNTHRTPVQLSRLPVTEPTTQSDEDQDKTPVVVRTHHHRHHAVPPLPIALSSKQQRRGSLDTTLDTEGYGGGRTSTPTMGVDFEELVLVHSTVTDDTRLRMDGCAPNMASSKQQHLRAESAGDSALSTSPVVTDLSTDSNKYSSWSSSDAPAPIISCSRGDGDHEADSSSLLMQDMSAKFDHTYINLNSGPDTKASSTATTVVDKQLVNRTYENLRPTEADLSTGSTHFENITNMPSPDKSVEYENQHLCRKPKRPHTYISAV